MGSARWSLSATVPADPDAVYAWLTDFTEDDHNSPAYHRGVARSRGEPPTTKPSASTRRILSRDGDVVRLDDQWGRNRFTPTVTLDPAARTVHVEASMGYDATWRVEPDAAGARILVEGSLGRGLLGTIMRLFEAKLQREMRHDFEGHLEDLRESLKLG